jgi:hypothetical protein
LIQIHSLGSVEDLDADDAVLFAEVEHDVVVDPEVGHLPRVIIQADVQQIVLLVIGDFHGRSRHSP